MTGCSAAVWEGTCVAMQNHPETGCLGSCGQFWLDTPDGLLLVGDDSGLGFCFDFPVGWHACSEDRPECACCVPEDP